MNGTQLKITCGNPRCQVGLLIQNPEKLKEAKCPKCGYLNPIPKTETPAPVAVLPLPVTLPAPLPPTQPALEEQLPDALGWLLAQGPMTPAQTLTLRRGTNTIGRVSAEVPSDCMLESTDAFMSRRHCTIEVKITPLGEVQYRIQDGAARPDGSWKNSGNGTCLDSAAYRLGEQDRVFLREGTRILLGETALLLKTYQLPEALRNAFRQQNEEDSDRTRIGGW